MIPLIFAFPVIRDKRKGQQRRQKLGLVVKINVESPMLLILMFYQAREVAYHLRKSRAVPHWCTVNV